MKKKQSQTIHIGNQGEYIVASLLSPKCIVRDVGQGNDTGIDLYCEIINDEDMSLSLHFFCQVKTYKKGRFSISQISNENYEYWGSQPVPVFLFVVEYNDVNSINEDRTIWIYDLPYILSKKDAESRNKREPTRDVEACFQLCDESNNKDKMTLIDFLYGHISWSYGLWYMRRFGLFLPNPEVKASKPEVMVGGFSYIYEEEIDKTAKAALNLLSIQSK